jgi:TetR/AcrR family transcriptional regulator, mexJK operon transcriptional repressor
MIRDGGAEQALARDDAGNVKVRQILGAARKIFMELGYGAASMDAIARQAGVSKATLYTHFEGKGALFAALIVIECRHLSDQIGQRAFDEPDIRRALRSLAEDFNNLLCTDESLAMYRIVVAETPRFPELGSIFYESGPKTMIDRIADLLQRAAERGQLHIADAHVAAIQFISLVRGDSHLTRILSVKSPAKATSIDYIDSCVDLFLGGYGTGRGKN